MYRFVPHTESFIVTSLVWRFSSWELWDGWWSTVGYCLTYQADSAGVKLIRPVNGQTPALSFTGKQCVERSLDWKLECFGSALISRHFWIGWPLAISQACLDLQLLLLKGSWECLFSLVKNKGHDNNNNIVANGHWVFAMGCATVWSTWKY